MRENKLFNIVIAKLKSIDITIVKKNCWKPQIRLYVRLHLNWRPWLLLYLLLLMITDISIICQHQRENDAFDIHQLQSTTSSIQVKGSS